jgi:hypothetical protein
LGVEYLGVFSIYFMLVYLRISTEEKDWG